jgi:uncharacterized protein (DUF983 family)
MKAPRSIPETFFRSLRLLCPACGRSSIVESPFHIKHHCSACGVLFKREDGFFVGAIMANVVTTEFTILATYLICLPLMGAHYQMMLLILFFIAILFPVTFYHHSWSFWLGLDHLVESLPSGQQKKL